MIDGDHGLSAAPQAKALGISRGSVYYPPRAVPPADLATMRRMDELHLDFPFAGSRMLRDLLNLRHGRRGPGLDRPVSGLLQWPEAAFEP